MAEKLSLVGFISELGVSRSLAGRCGHVSRENRAQDQGTLHGPGWSCASRRGLAATHRAGVPPRVRLNCENVPAGTNAATTRAKKMLEIANDLRALLSEQA